MEFLFLSVSRAEVGLLSNFDVCKIVLHVPISDGCSSFLRTEDLSRNREETYSIGTNACCEQTKNAPKGYELLTKMHRT